MQGQDIPPLPPGLRLVSGGGAPTPPPAAPRRAPAPRAAARPVSFTDDRDAMIRTVIGEASNQGPDGQTAVAAVIANRARQNGRPARDVVLERNQFEPWGNATTAQRLMAVAADDPRYIQAAAAVDRAMAGDDPTGGADHFFAPRAQAALGREVPSWAQGRDPTVIGDHNFYNLGGSTEEHRQAPPQPDVPPLPPGLQLVSGPLDDLNIHRPEMVDMDAAARLGDRPQAYTGPGSSQDNPFVVRDDASPEYNEQLQNLRRGMWVTHPTRGVVQLAGDAHIRSENDGDLAEGQARFHETNAGDNARAFAMATAEQIPGLDEAAVAAAGLVNGRGFSETRDSYQAAQAVDNQTSRGYRVAGGLSGAGLTLLAPGTKEAGAFIKAGQAGLNQTARAAAVGAGAGALFGAGNSEGGLEDRAKAGLLDAGVGAATGGLLDAGGQWAAQSARVGAEAAPSAQRLLSREGVNLTPGQMLQDVPVVGGLIRATEDNITGVLPFVQSARNEGVRDLNRAAINRSLSHIGQTLPRKVEVGYPAVEEAQRRLGAAYDEVLPSVSATLDRPLYDDIAKVLMDAGAEMPVDQLDQLRRVLETRVFRNVDQADATISGEQFKRIESELGALAREYRTALDPSARSVGTAIEGFRTGLRDMIARQNPAQADRIRAINAGYAELVRVERAAGGSAAQARGGVFTGGELSNAVGVGAGRSERARGGALMQDLASAARQVLPNKVGDSGTGSRIVGAGLLGGAIPLPQVAVPLIASALAYSKPAQVALNAIYRATDRQAASRGLAQLQQFASQNPALQPYYADAARHLQAAFEGSSPAPAPEARGLLSPTSR